MNIRITRGNNLKEKKMSAHTQKWESLKRDRGSSREKAAIQSAGSWLSVTNIEHFRNNQSSNPVSVVSRRFPSCVIVKVPSSRKKHIGALQIYSENDRNFHKNFVILGGLKNKI